MTPQLFSSPDWCNRLRLSHDQIFLFQLNKYLFYGFCCSVLHIYLTQYILYPLLVQSCLVSVMSLFRTLSRSLSSLANLATNITPAPPTSAPTSFVNTLDIVTTAVSAITIYDGTFSTIGAFRAQSLSALAQIDIMVRQYQLFISWDNSISSFNK